MKKLRALLIAVIALSESVSLMAATTTYDEVVKGKTCKSSVSQSIECDYKVGASLVVTIAGVGEPYAGITMMKSDFNGDYYAGVGVLHGCIVVNMGTSNPAFSMGVDAALISPKNGKVYRKWQDCQAGS